MKNCSEFGCCSGVGFFKHAIRVIERSRYCFRFAELRIPHGNVCFASVLKGRGGGKGVRVTELLHLRENFQCFGEP